MGFLQVLLQCHVSTVYAKEKQIHAKQYTPYMDTQHTQEAAFLFLGARFGGTERGGRVGGSRDVLVLVYFHPRHDPVYSFSFNTKRL